MIRVFSEARVEGGCGGMFEVELATVQHTGGTDVLAFVHNERTGERIVRLFEEQPTDGHIYAAVDWALQLTSLTEPATLLRSPLAGDFLRARPLMVVRDDASGSGLPLVRGR